MADWIKCSERLPEIGVEVWVYRPLAHLSNDSHMRTATRQAYESKSPQGVSHPFSCWCHVTHWQPLPSLPEQE